MAEETRRKTGSRATGSRGTGTGERVLGALAGQARQLVAAAGDRALSAASDWAGDTTRRLTEYAEHGGGPGLAAAAAGAKRLASGKSPSDAALHAGMAGVKERIGRAFGGKSGRGGKKKLKVTNIVETIDVGVPVRVAYNQWTQFEDFPSFTKKVEHVERTGEDKLTWKAQVFWSHRTWESTIVDQVPDRRVVWRSTGEKGSVDGSVTFHELAPELTRILVVLEYHPQGLFERTGNIWRAQGRRARLELKHFARHVATQTVLHPDEVEGWRGEIRDGRVVRSHQDGVAEEQAADGSSAEDRSATDRSARNGAADRRSARDAAAKGRSATDGAATDGAAEGRSAKDAAAKDSAAGGRSAAAGSEAATGRRPARRESAGTARRAAAPRQSSAGQPAPRQSAARRPASTGQSTTTRDRRRDQ